MTLRLGNRGQKVKELQQILKAQGFYYDKVDGVFGRKTYEAVIYFQMTHIDWEGKPLTPDGIVGEKTWWALRHPSGSYQRNFIEARVPEGVTPMRGALLSLALKEWRAGAREEPDGSNYGNGVSRYYDIFGSPHPSPMAWCSVFWNWVWKKALNILPLGYPEPSTTRVYLWAKERGYLKDPKSYSPKPADAFILQKRDEDGNLLWRGHIGFVLSVSQEGEAFNTIEGNCGNRVKVGLRMVSQETLEGFINNFPESEQPESFERGLFSAKSVARLSTR